MTHTLNDYRYLMRNWRLTPGQLPYVRMWLPLCVYWGAKWGSASLVDALRESQWLGKSGGMVMLRVFAQSTGRRNGWTLWLWSGWTLMGIERRNDTEGFMLCYLRVTTAGKNIDLNYAHVGYCYYFTVRLLKYKHMPHTHTQTHPQDLISVPPIYKQNPIHNTHMHMFIIQYITVS